jgi:hypothetical protein
MYNDRDVKTADALAAGVVSGGGMLAILGAIIAAIVLHPALAITLAAVGAILSEPPRAYSAGPRVAG